MRQKSPHKVLLVFPESHYNSRGGRNPVTGVSSGHQGAKALPAWGGPSPSATIWEWPEGGSSH